MITIQAREGIMHVSLKKLINCSELIIKTMETIGDGVLCVSGDIATGTKLNGENLPFDKFTKILAVVNHYKDSCDLPFESLERFIKSLFKKAVETDIVFLIEQVLSTPASGDASLWEISKLIPLLESDDFELFYNFVCKHNLNFYTCLESYEEGFNDFEVSIEEIKRTAENKFLTYFTYLSMNDMSDMVETNKEHFINSWIQKTMMQRRIICVKDRYFSLPSK